MSYDQFDSQEVRAGWTTLLRQASMTAGEYYAKALMEMAGATEQRIEPGNFGHATELARVAAMDFHTASMSIAAQKIAEAINNLADAIGTRE